VRRADVRPATRADAAALADLAAATFPLACPPGTPDGDVAAFVAAHLTPGRFAERLAEPDRYAIHVAGQPDVLDGYVLAVVPRTVQEVPGGDGEVAVAVRPRPVAELSKCYVRAELHGSGLAGALLDAVHADLAGRQVGGVPLAAVWLGTNRGNRRARRFYVREGYAPVGRRTFLVGERVNDDVVMVRPLAAAGRTDADR
jgi:tRNA (guanine37-N1)-methyltransferase